MAYQVCSKSVLAYLGWTVYVWVQKKDSPSEYIFNVAQRFSICWPHVYTCLRAQYIQGSHHWRLEVVFNVYSEGILTR